MRKVAIQNYMSFPIHVTVVAFPPATLRFVFSIRQVPVPTGEVVGREVIQPEQGIVTDPMDESLFITFTQQGFGDDFRLSQRDLVDDKGVELIEFTIHEPEARADN